MADFRSEKLVYSISKELVRVGGDVVVPPNTNSILVVNIGNVLVTVEGFPLNAKPAVNANGESWTIGGNKGEVIDRRTIQIDFAAPGGLVFVQFKSYPNC